MATHEQPKTYEQLLEMWVSESGIMHIAHHIAAARYASKQRWLGATAAGLGAIVASSAFVAAAKGQDPMLLLLTGFVSMVAAVISAAVASLDAGGKAQRHHAAAAAFQGVRREIEEELVRCSDGKPKDSYEHIRKRWTAALENSIPLPPKIHEKTKEKFAKPSQKE